MPDKKQLPQVKKTTKKVKFVGTQEFIDAKTGELVKMSVTDIEERDFNFMKIWMKNYINAMEMIGNQKTKIAFWIIENLDAQNRLVSTNREIAEATDTSLQTVSKTMVILQNEDFLSKIRNGCYMVDPDILFKGQHAKRMNVLNKYHAIGENKPELTKAEKIAKIEQSISLLQSELQELKKEPIDLELKGQTQLNEDGEVIQKAVVVSN